MHLRTRRGGKCAEIHPHLNCVHCYAAALTDCFAPTCVIHSLIDMHPQCRTACVYRSQDAIIAKSEVELKRHTDEIERKTRETDNLNRKLERLLAAQPGTLAVCAQGL